MKELPLLTAQINREGELFSPYPLYSGGNAMSYKKATYTALAVIVLIGVVYLTAASRLPQSNALTLGPDYFPNILGVLLIVLCILSFFQTWRKSDEGMEIANFKTILITLGIVALFVLAWQYAGYFYVLVFLTLFILFSLYSLKSERKKRVWIHGAISLGTVGAIYLIFEVVIGIRF